jgi:hypothetical protein
MAATTFFIYFETKGVKDTLGLSAGDMTPKLAYNLQVFRPLPIGTQLAILHIRFQVVLNEYSPEQDTHYVYCLPTKTLTNEDKDELLKIAPNWGWVDMAGPLSI